VRFGWEEGALVVAAAMLAGVVLAMIPLAQARAETSALREGSRGLTLSRRRVAVRGALVVGQVAAALHYFPISPLRYGLVILGLAYALGTAAGALEEGRPWRSALLEPVVMLVFLWGLAIGMRD
jgi:hypothetical protein